MPNLLRVLATLALMPSAAVAIDTVDVDVDKYFTGRWFQMYADAYVMDTFERNAVCIAADYSILDDGTVSVFNSERLGSADGPPSNISGTATTTDEPGQFRVTFDSDGVAFPAPYWVVGLGPENTDGLYDWAIVSDKLQLSLFVLARDVDDFATLYDDEVTALLADLGFDKKINTPIQNYNGDDCVYAAPPTQPPAVAPPAATGSCPTVEPVDGLDLDEFLRATWYVQQQQITGYQSEDELFCVTATYDLEGESVPRFDGTVVSVYNYADEGAVNGQPTNTANGTVLCARAVDDEQAANLAVAPCFLPNKLAGPYWVVAYASDENGAYTWAAVSGGQPTEQYDDGCTTKLTGTNGSGLWIFTRDPVASEEDVEAARQALTDLGYTLSQLLNVAQDGCTYDHAFIKAN